jgi:hypothetical protein
MARLLHSNISLYYTFYNNQLFSIFIHISSFKGW